MGEVTLERAANLWVGIMSLAIVGMLWASTYDRYTEIFLFLVLAVGCLFPPNRRGK